LDARKETCVILKPVVEPVVLRREPDEDPCRLSVTGDDYLPVLGFPQVPGEVVLDLRQRNLLHSGFPNRASHDSTSDFAMIASTSSGSSGAGTSASATSGGGMESGNQSISDQRLRRRRSWPNRHPARFHSSALIIFPTRPRISSRIRRTSSMGLPFGSVSGQSS